jgi:hypothetical protein
MTKVLTKRNAVLGWATWSVGKRLAKRKAKGAIHAVESGRPNPSAIATTVAALAGLLLFWRKRHRGGEPAEAA